MVETFATAIDVDLNGSDETGYMSRCDESQAIRNPFDVDGGLVNFVVSMAILKIVIYEVELDSSKYEGSR